MTSKILYKIVICVLFSTAYSYAFFQVESPPDDLRIDHTTIKLSTQGNNTYHIYDNQIFSVDSIILSPKKEGFISFCGIQIDIPLRLLSASVLHDQDALNRMLSVNLRIRLLLEEYMALKKRAEQFGEEKRTGSPTGSNEQATKPAQVDIPQNDSKLDVLEKALTNLQRINDVPLYFYDSNDIVLSDPIMALQYTPGSPTRSGAGSKRPDQVQADSAQYGPPVNSGSSASVNRENTELPWLFKILLDAFNYIINNRLEIILYALFVVLISFLVSIKVHK